MNAAHVMFAAALSMVPLGHDASDGPLSSLASATAWINSSPLTATSLRGKVVLVDFWTYTCINWRRTLPYVRAWAEKYKDRGLVVIGVHSPEFAFEKELTNVQREAQAQQVAYPIAVDNNMTIWRAFENNYWPALYLIDSLGKIRYHKFGEGEYEQAERMIQQLLTEAGHTGVPHDLVSVDGRGAEAQPDWTNLKSSENYVGYGRTEGFASAGGVVPDHGHRYTALTTLRLNQWALEGQWTISRESIRSNQADGKIAYRFHARDLHLVMGAAVRGHAIRFRVLIDGVPPGPAHGVDVDSNGYGTLDRQRMYQLIRQHGAIGDRLFEITFLDEGAEAFSFTFG